MSDLSDSESNIDLTEDVVEIRPIRPRRNFEAFKEVADDNKAVNRNSFVDSHPSHSPTYPGVQCLQMQKMRMQPEVRNIESDNPNSFPPIIPLNVGGVKYMTRLSTLRKYPDSMLAALFSGRHTVDRDEYGNFFLDSNGSLFGHILEFLRNSTLPPNEMAIPVLREANYYGLQELVDKLHLKPQVALLHVKEAHRAQFPDYYEIKEKIIRIAIENAIATRIGEVCIYAFKNEFTAKAPTFNPVHDCVAKQAHLCVGPWTANADEEIFMKCLESDLTEDGFQLRPREPKRKCRYYHGQTCQKFIYKVQFLF